MIFLYGHSMSTVIALEVAAKLEKVDGVILINPPWKMKAAKGMSPGWTDYAKFAWYYLFAPHTPIVNMGGDPALIENREERNEAQARLNDPLLMIYGDNDSIVDRTGCDEIFSAWKNANKTFKVVPNGPHGKKTALAAMGWITEWIAALVHRRASHPALARRSSSSAICLVSASSVRLRLSSHSRCCAPRSRISAFS